MSSNRNWHSVRLCVGAIVGNIGDDIDEMSVWTARLHCLILGI